MSAQSTKLSPAALIAAAKAPLLAYNEKNWDGLKSSLTPDVVYDEVGTRRKVHGIESVLTVMKAWAEAIPDSMATVNSACTSDETVVLEITWTGTHKGTLQSAAGAIPATGKPIQLRACIVCELSGERTRAQRQYFDMGTILEQIGKNS